MSEKATCEYCGREFERPKGMATVDTCDDPDCIAKNASEQDYYWRERWANECMEAAAGEVRDE